MAAKTYTGKPCPQGHTERYLRNRDCATCARERTRRWQKANPEKYREKERRRREANREKVRERQRRWREANREKECERLRRWRENHPHTQRVREAKAGGCAQCGKRPDDLAELHLHHTDPASKSFNLANAYAHPLAEVEAELAKCEVLCGPCHREHHKAAKQEAAESR